jgi:AraC family transcriptional regulator of arabinose operon
MRNEVFVSTYVPAVHLLVAGARSGMRVRSERPSGFDSWYLIYTLKGAVHFTAPEPGMTAQAGDLALIKPNLPLLYSNTPSRRTWSWKYVIFRPRPHWEPLLSWPEVAAGLMRISTKPGRRRERILRLFDDLLDHSRRRGLRAELLAMNTLERMLIEIEPANPDRHKQHTDDRIDRVLRYIDRHLDGYLDVPALATVAGLSASRFAHLFRERTGLAPARCVESRRMERARTLLESTDLPMREVAQQVGYDPQHFAKRFRHVHSMTPGQYRKGPGRMNL